jgi:hypothetical protein
VAHHPTVIGRPAQHATHLARRHDAAAAAWASTTVVLVLTLLTRGLTTVTTGPVGVAAAAVVASAAALAAHQSNRRYSAGRRAAAGRNSERRVGKVLERTAAATVIHGARIGHGDCDHVVLGPMFVAVETKTGRGPVRVNGTTMTVGSRTLPRNPVSQIRNQMNMIRRRTGHTPDPVVCITDMVGAPFITDGVTVCNAADLAAVIANSRRRLNQVEHDRVVAALTPTA